MNILQVILHIGTIIQAGKDLEATVADAIKRNGKWEADAKALLEDLKRIVDSGMISIPGLTSEQLDALISDLESAV